MMEPSLEGHIREVLPGEAQRRALSFAACLRKLEMDFERGGGYWIDKRYWVIKHNGEYVCYLLINGYGANRHMDEPEGWIIWFQNHPSFEKASVDESINEASWKNVDICKHCGACSGGTRKWVFGKALDDVCSTVFRFDNPNESELAFAKQLLAIRTMAE